MQIFRVIIRRLLLWSNVLLAIALLCSFFLTFADPSAFWPAGFAGLPFIYLWLACLLLIPVWACFRSKYWLVSLPALLLTLPGLTHSWGFHPSGRQQTPGAASFTVMSFNCSIMGFSDHAKDSLIPARIYDELKKARPDVLCLQEFFTTSGTQAPNHADSIRKKLGYEYAYIINQYNHWHYWHFGMALFSRFPLVDTANIPLNSQSRFDVLMHARLLVNGDTVRLLSAHLASYHLQKEEYAVVSSPDGLFRRVAAKMKRAFVPRIEQARILQREIAATREPLIVVGDLNDLPVSYTYRTVRGNLQDAFLAQGAGLGRTFSALAPHLRIDYIFPGAHFKVEDFSIHRRRGFEHFPIMARLSIRK